MLSCRVGSQSPEWLIPIKIRTVVTKNGEAKKQTYFDAPLPPAVVGAREKLAAAGRASVLAALQVRSDTLFRAFVG